MTTASPHAADVLVIGWGLAGLVAATEAAVRAYQVKVGLVPDGIAGEKTIAVLADSDLLRQLAQADEDVASGRIETADELAEAMRRRRTTA